MSSSLLVDEVPLLPGTLGDSSVVNLPLLGCQIEAVSSNQYRQPTDFPLLLLPGTKCFFYLSLFYAILQSSNPTPFLLRSPA